MLNLNDFVLRLKQVIAWTAHLTQGFDFPVNYQTANLGAVFRQLNPVIDGEPLFTIKAGYTTWNADDYSIVNYKRALEAAFKQRDSAAVRLEFDFSSFQELGRILCFETMVTTHDRAAIEETNNFVDESDVPPIDTWFALEEFPRHDKTILYCWIPKEFESTMQRAIDVEPLGSYYWLDEQPTMFYNKVLLNVKESA
jgi:hypothetical protein